MSFVGMAFCLAGVRGVSCGDDILGIHEDRELRQGQINQVTPSVVDTLTDLAGRVRAMIS
jgi:hypothetical protein